MPSFFDFQQGHDPRGATSDSSPLLGRFRAVPDASRRNGAHRNSLSLLGSFTTGRRYAGVFGNRDTGDDSSSEGQDGDAVGVVKGLSRTLRDLWLDPKQAAVARVVDKWWTRWTVLVVLPAALAVAWCALPFPQYDLPDDDDVQAFSFGLDALGHKVPGHGEARVEINFWFFLFVYYGFYNITALMWITKVFNIYSLNWWPQSLGFPFTVSVIATISIAAPIPIYYFPQSRYFTKHNTVWICWTFFTMAMPLIIAFAILMNHERHLGLRQSLSETQRIFTSSWWTGETETIVGRDPQRRPAVQQSTFDPDAPLEVALATDNMNRRELSLRKRWIPASFVRFIWFCLALFIGMLAYVLGEAYAETYLRTLPHTTLATIVYVYSWVATVHILDGIVGWILGGNEGERVGSYPLGWIFKLYFALTYQTYVRALYARLRSPEQFIYLQILSSSFLIILGPLTMSKPFHYVLSVLSINGQTLPSYQKFCARNIFIRGLAENVSMLTFVGSILVLHYGSNKDVYPYFAFDSENSPPQFSRGSLPIGGGEMYDFGLTFYASLVTWACEIVAGWIVRRILWYGWASDVTGEAKADLAMWPELLPTGVVVMVHVLQNMLFSIVRLRFH
ncbi:Uncharacterized protein LHYA1_G006504 [Lachnellula hyalina]|uniref:Uncharacterized protein n=1 Tax=Lachnellula hyalina TaxID=1316788 RepID=A0A8H8TWS0_9HELO|nr:Uncharacterized protein LHYA1_G006504 [Lachnellula hyalina]TVY25224.1 Uncharacterized protein LHYA1_G006504 [Lachnellula hyalina]